MALFNINNIDSQLDEQDFSKNKLINGAMKIAQRGTSTTGWTSDEYSTLDRWRTRVNGLGEWTVSQETDAPDGFTKSLKMDCTTADASPASGDYLIVEQRIEGQNVQDLKYGTSSAVFLTASFWVKSNLTGTFHVGLFSDDNSFKHNESSYTINSSGTWEYKTVTFSGDTTNSLDDDNNSSLRLWFFLDSGSNFSGGTPPSSWATYTTTNVRPSGATSLGSSTDNYWQITGVQLEKGTEATEFENRSVGQELALCQRYFQASESVGAMAVTSISTNRCFPANGWDFKVTMRATPTITVFTGLNSTGTSGSIQTYSGAVAKSINSVPNVNPDNAGNYIQLTSSSLTNDEPLAGSMEASAEL